MTVFTKKIDIGKFCQILPKISNFLGKMSFPHPFFANFTNITENLERIKKAKTWNMKKNIFHRFFHLILLHRFFSGKSMKCHEKHGSLLKNCSLTDLDIHTIFIVAVSN